LSPLPTARQGQQLQVKKRPIEFGYWPMGRTTRRYGLQSPVYCSDPWPVLHQRIRTECPAQQRDAALAFLDQGRSLYAAAVDRPLSAARPLILYYCYLNLAKALILTRDQRRVLDRAQHGLSEQVDPGNVELVDSYLDAFPSTKSKVNVFHEFLRAVSGEGLSEQIQLRLPHLLPQVIAGHRLWVSASATNRERFIAVERFNLMHDARAKEIWIRLNIFADGLGLLGLTHAELLQRAGLDASFAEVRCGETLNGRKLVCLEQKIGRRYKSRPSDEVANLVSDVRPHLWATALMYTPYRRYYLYASPSLEQYALLPQAGAVYAITYFLGSIARYRPHHIQKIMEGSYGPWLHSFLTEQPSQFLFLLASDIARQDLLKAAIA
jgi:YaaC-like Protein